MDGALRFWHSSSRGVGDVQSGQRRKEWAEAEWPETEKKSRGQYSDPPGAAPGDLEDRRLLTTVAISAVQNATEGGANGYFRLSRTEWDEPLAVSYYVDSYQSTAVNGVDCSYLPGTSQWSDEGYVTFPTGHATVDIPVQAINDSLVEGNETVRIVLQPGGGCCGGDSYSLGTPYHATLSIIDDDVAPTVWVDSVVNASEGVSAGYIRLRRDVTAAPLTVQYYFDDTVQNAATNGLDFPYLPGTYEWENTGYVTFGTGQATVDLAVNPTGSYNDLLVEGDETVRIVLQQGGGCCGAGVYQLGTPTVGTLTIVDDDVAPTVWVDSVVNASEGVSAGYIRLRRDVTAAPLTVQYYFDDTVQNAATNGLDFPYLPGTYEWENTGYVTFGSGQATVDLAVNPTGSYDDLLVEGNETVRIVLQQGGGCCGAGVYQLGTPTVGTLTITDNDEFALISVAATQNAVEGSQHGYFRLARTGPTNRALTVYYSIDAYYTTATNGVDMESLPGTTSSMYDYGGRITFQSGQSYVDIPVIPIDDSLVEGDESIRISLVEYEYEWGESSTSYRLGSPSSATVTLFGNDAPGPPTVFIASTRNATEGGQAGRFRLVRGGSLASELTVTYAIDAASTAVNGEDVYHLSGSSAELPLSGSLTFGAGNAYADLMVVAIEDDLLEGPEWLRISIDTSSSYYVGTPSVAAVTVEDNDALPLVSLGKVASEVQTLVLPRASGGAWTVALNGHTSAPLPVGASALQVQTALESLSSIGPGNVTVSGAGTLKSPYTVTFTGALAQTDMDPLSVNGANLTGVAQASATVITEVDGVDGRNEIFDTPILSVRFSFPGDKPKIQRETTA